MAATTSARVARAPSSIGGRLGAWQLSLVKLWRTQAGSGRLSITSSPRQTGLKVAGAALGLEIAATGSGAALTTGKISEAAATATTPKARAILIHIRRAVPFPREQTTGIRACQLAPPQMQTALPDRKRRSIGVNRPSDGDA